MALAAGLAVTFSAVLTADAATGDTRPAAQADWHVAPDGKDTNPGTAQAPFATLGRAREAVRQQVACGLTKDILVALRGGTYPQTETLVFGPQDSGTQKYSIAYAAYPGQKVVLSGGRKITGWKKGQGENWTTEVPEVKAGRWYFRELYVGGRRAVRARTPNIDDQAPWWHIVKSTAATDPPPPENADITASVTGPILAYSNPEDVELVYIANNNGSRKRLGTINEKEQTFTLPAPHQWPPRAFGTEWKFSIPCQGLACYLENGLEMLDQPGEWYLDRHTGILTYRPRAGEDLTRDEVMAPVVAKTLLAVIGTPERPVLNLHFKGLHVQHVKWDIPPWGYMGMACCTMAVGKDPKPGWQWVEAAVEYEHARGCSFTDGGIAHVGSIGMCLRRGTADIAIEGNDIGDLGAGGIGAGYMENAAYGYVHAPPPEPNEFKGFRIANNHVHDCGLEDYGAFGIEVSEVQDCVIAHNLVHDTAYFGICMAGSQRRDAVFARNNSIEHNHIYNAMKVTVDGAGMYLTFALPEQGCLVLGNLLHDVYPNRFSDRPFGPYSAAGIYLDGNATGYRFENNVVYKTGSAKFVNGQGASTWGDNTLLEDELPPPEFIEAMRECAGLEPAYRRNLLKTETSRWDCHPLTETDMAGKGWSGYQLNRADEDAGVVEVFHQDGSKGEAERFKLRGLSGPAMYELKVWVASLEGGGGLRGVQPLPDAEEMLGKGNARMSGRQLMEDGLPVALAKPQVAWIAYRQIK